MITRSLVLSLAVSGAALFAGPPTRTAHTPKAAPIRFTPPLDAARTIQVTETVFEADGVSPTGPLRRAGTTTFRVERPDKFRVEFDEGRPGGQHELMFSDGKTMTTFDGKTSSSRPAGGAEWPFPLVGLLNNMPGAVSAVPAVRAGKKTLLAVRTDAGGNRSEFWFDPKTHLLLRWLLFITWKGKTRETMRTDFSGWVLNAPLPAATFRAPPGGGGRK